MSTDNFPGTRAFLLGLGAIAQYRSQEHEQGVTDRHGPDDIDGIGKVPPKAGHRDRLQARVIKLREHHDRLADRCPKAKLDLEMMIEQVKPDYAIDQRKYQGSQQYLHSL